MRLHDESQERNKRQATATSDLKNLDGFTEVIAQQTEVIEQQLEAGSFLYGCTLSDVVVGPLFSPLQGSLLSKGTLEVIRRCSLSFVGLEVSVGKHCFKYSNCTEHYEQSLCPLTASIIICFEIAHFQSHVSNRPFPICS